MGTIKIGMLGKLYKRIKTRNFSFITNILLYLVAVILALPLFFLLSPHLPEINIPLGAGIHLEHLLFSILVVGIVHIHSDQAKAFGA